MLKSLTLNLKTLNFYFFDFQLEIVKANMTFTNQSMIIHVKDKQKAMQWSKCRKYFKNQQESCKKLIKFYSVTC